MISSSTRVLHADRIVASSASDAAQGDRPGPCGPVLPDEVVVLKTRSAKLETTGQTLAECDCEHFDSFLRGDWSRTLDERGRPELRLDVDDKVFKHTLVRMQTQTSSVPPSFDAARIQEQLRQLRFLCHRPTLEVDAAAWENAMTIPPVYVRIEPGESHLGSPAHEAGRRKEETEVLARVTQPYLLKADRFTQQEFLDVMGYNPSYFTANPLGGLAGQCPVEYLTWFQALACCNAMSIRDGLRPCYNLGGWTGRADAGEYPGPKNVPWDLTANGFRLPTLAEFVRAARAGTRGATYAAPHQTLNGIAHCDNSDGRTRPVGQETPNSWGVRPYGNVYIWVWDWYSDLPTGGDDPKGPNTGSSRVVVGGSYNSKGSDVRAAFRHRGAPSNKFTNLGLCPARSLFP